MNRFRNYVLMGAGISALVMVVGVFSAGPAIAQAVRAALVSNVDDPGRIPYRFQGFCSLLNTDTCNVTLPTVQAGKRLVITHVSGEVSESDPGGTLVHVRVISGNEANPPVTFQGSFGGLNVFVFDQQVLIYGLAGEAPFAQIALGVAPSSPASLSIVNFSGYMLDCNAGPCAAIVP